MTKTNILKHYFRSRDAGMSEFESIIYALQEAKKDEAKESEVVKLINRERLAREIS